MIHSGLQSISVNSSPELGLSRALAFCRYTALLVWFLVMVGIVHAQSDSNRGANESVVEISGVTNSTVFGMGKTVKITGTVKQGAIAFGGDVIVAGTVEGDVAAIGGSVVQLAEQRSAVM